MAPSLEVLPGLPATGPYPEQFTTRGGTHREGFVVRIVPDRAAPWVGNFQPGIGGISRVALHPDGKTLFVVAGGLAYPIDPESRTLVAPAVDDYIQDVCAVGERLVLVGWSELTVVGPGSQRWRTPPLASDGITDLSIEGDRLFATGWDECGEVQRPIELDLRERAIVMRAIGVNVTPSIPQSVWGSLKRIVQRLFRPRGA